MPERGLETGHPRLREGGRFFLLLVGLALLGGAAPSAQQIGAPPDAAEILRRAEQVRSPDLDYAVDFELFAVNPSSGWKRRSAHYTMIAHGKNYSLVLMRQPKNFYPGMLLISDGLYWMLLPRSTRHIQLTPRHVLNGDVSNGDLARGNLLTNYDAYLWGDGQVGNRDCWRLDLHRRPGRALYEKIVAWIDKENYFPRKFEYYGRTGELLKVARYQDYRDGEIGVRSMRIVVENRVRIGEKTTLTFSNLRRIDAGGLSYTPEILRPFRDAALAVLDETGAQAQPEELLRLLGAAAR